MGKDYASIIMDTGGSFVRGAPWRDPGFAPGAGVLDLSQSVFRPGNATRVAGLLQALPMVKASLVQIDVGDGALTPTVLKVTRKNAAPSGVASSIYTDISPPGGLAEGPKAQIDPPPLTFDLPLVRLGRRIAVPKIDASVAPASSKNAGLWRVEATIPELLAELDKGLGQNLTDGPNVVFKGLPTLSTLAGGAPATFGEAAVRLLLQTLSSGRGAGEGAQCLLGNGDALRMLALDPVSKTNGSCRWGHDARTGLWTFHFLGTPCYAVDTLTVASETSLYAANLGPSGLQLVHAYGTAQTFGLQVDEEPTQTITATRGLVAHGAWSLALWEPLALRHFAGLAVTP